MEFTKKEGLVLCLLSENLTNEQIGKHLGLKKETIKTHVSNILRKLDVTNRRAAANWARANGYKRAGQEDGTPTPHLPFHKLTPRLYETVTFVAQGMMNSEIATELGISSLTVKSYLDQIGNILGERDRYAIAKAYDKYLASKAADS